MRERIQWIDTARGLAMMAVLLLHTEVYYTSRDIIPYSMYVDDALAIFFFLSGYLFDRPSLKFSARAKLKAMARTLLVPYIIFTTAMALPKAFAHSHIISLDSTLKPILTGEASWFVATLMVSETYYVFVTAMARCTTKTCATGLIASTLTAVIPFTLYRCIDGGFHLEVMNAASIALLFMQAGHMYRVLEENLQCPDHCKPKVRDRRCYQRWVLAASVLLLVGVKCYVWENDLHLIFFNVHIDSYPLFLADCLPACLVLVECCKLVPKDRVKLLRWIGRHSLVIYFLCGGIPLMVSYIMPPYQGCYALVLATYVVVCAVACGAAWAVYRYLPWCVGRW